MGKLFKPVMGTPIDDYLVKMVADVKEDHQDNPSIGPRMGRSAKEVESIAESVRRSLNTGACMNESQAAEVRSSILYDRRADAKVVKELIDRINGFRLDCESCLKNDCPQRDPKVPLIQGFPDGLSTRSSTLLKNSGITCIDELCQKTEHDLMSLGHFGRVRLKEVKDYLAKHGRSLKTTIVAIENNAQQESEYGALPVNALELSNFVLNKLKEMGVQTLGDLCEKSAQDLLRVRGFGIKSLRHVREALFYYEGIKLKGD